MYYVKCPVCGDVIEVSVLSDEETCFNCYTHYKVTPRNTMKAPPYDLFIGIAIAILLLGMFISNGAFDIDAGIADYIMIGVFMVLALTIVSATELIRKYIESRLRGQKKKD